MKNIKHLLTLAKRNKGNHGAVDKTICFKNNELILTDHNITTTVRCTKPQEWEAIPDGIYFASEIMLLLNKWVRGAPCDKKERIGLEVSYATKVDSFTAPTRTVYIVRIAEADHYPIVEWLERVKTHHHPFYVLEPTKQFSSFRAKNDSRASLNGYGVTMTYDYSAINATDAHRLVQAQLPKSWNILSESKHENVYSSFLSDVLDQFNTELTIETGTFKDKVDSDEEQYIRTRLLQDFNFVSNLNVSRKYPDIDRVIPKQTTKFFSIKSSELMIALEYVKVTGEYNPAVLNITNKKINLSSLAGKVSLDNIELHHEEDFNASFNFNWKYLKDLGNVFKGVIEFHINVASPLSSMLFMEPDSTTKVVIMPLRG